MRALLVALLLMMLALAGCADNSNDDPTPSSSTTSTSRTTTSSSTTTSSTSTTTSAAPKPNEAPVAVLSSNGTSGLAPLAIRFTLGGTDPENAPLTYTLAFGDGSANQQGSLPATLNHTFAAGNHTVRLTVSDGKLTDEATLTVSALAGPGIPPPVTFNGTASGICQLFDPTTFEDVCLPPDSVIEHNFTMAAPVTKIVATLTWKFDVPTASDLDLSIFDATGAEVASSGCANVDPLPDPEIPGVGPFFGCVRGNSEEAVLEGIALTQAATWKAVIVPYQAPMVPYTLTITYS